MIKSEILVPLLNANEPEARLIGIHAKDGQVVEEGMLLFTIETTKAAVDIEAPDNGFVHILVKKGATLAVGDRIAVITTNIDEKIEFNTGSKLFIHPVGDLRITEPARSLAESLGVELASLPTDRLITKEFIQQKAAVSEKIQIELPAVEKPYLVIYGGGGHAKAIMDLVKQTNLYSIAGIVDDLIPAGTLILGFRVLGTRLVLPALFKQGVKLAANGVGGILNIAVRVQVFELLKKSGFIFPALIHPRATIEPSAIVGDGSQVFANAYVGSEAVLHPMSMINTNAVVSHDCEIGKYSHVAPGALLAGHVHIGERTLVGMGVTTTIGVRIGSGVRIGNGAIVLADVPDRTIIQAGRYWVGKADSGKQ
jgi:sugar O-acyltransferase (sialic acid O-acetyltransferase NeuD family)